MGSSIEIIAPKRATLEAVLRDSISETGVESLGLAVAYVSVYGAQFLRSIVRDTSVTNVRLITDIRDGITHPGALRLALDERWKVRVVRQTSGTFHAKVYVGGKDFSDDGALAEPRVCIIGSSNLTNGGLNNNVECSIVNTSGDVFRDSARAFRELWSFGRPLDRNSLEEYEAYFAERNRVRSPDDLQVLGIADQPPDVIDRFEETPRTERRLAEPSMATRAATSAWTGLESSTGEYRFQVEFPRAAGEVLGRLIGTGGRSAQVNVLCEDGVVRQMTYRFYQDNSMFRLNVANEVPGVQDARDRHSGIALIEKIERPDATVRLTVEHDKKAINDVIRRSLALGTLSQTPTRLYGWY